MNWSQTFGILRIVVPAIIAVLAYMGFISDSVATNLTAMILTALGSAAISGYANTNLNLSKAVAAVPGLTVHADITAPPEIQQVAQARSVPDIVPAAPPPFVPSNLSQRR